MKWKGFKSNDSTWEPIGKLQKVYDFVNRFNVPCDNDADQVFKPSKGDEAAAPVAEKNAMEDKLFEGLWNPFLHETDPSSI